MRISGLGQKVHLRLASGKWKSNVKTSGNEPLSEQLSAAFRGHRKGDRSPIRGFPLIRGTIRGPHNKQDFSILGFCVEVPVFWETTIHL